MNVVRQKVAVGNHGIYQFFGFQVLAATKPQLGQGYGFYYQTQPADVVHLVWTGLSDVSYHPAAIVDIEFFLDFLEDL